MVVAGALREVERGLPSSMKMQSAHTPLAIFAELVILRRWLSTQRAHGTLWPRMAFLWFRP